MSVSVDIYQISHPASVRFEMIMLQQYYKTAPDKLHDGWQHRRSVGRVFGEK